MTKFLGYEITNIPCGMVARFGDERRLKQLWDFAASASGPVIVDFWR